MFHKIIQCALCKYAQITVTTHASDGVHDPVVAAINATSLALCQSNTLWDGPIGCVRIAYVEGQLIVNPQVEQIKSSRLDLVYAGTSQRPLMYDIQLTHVYISLTLS